MDVANNGKTAADEILAADDEEEGEETSGTQGKGRSTAVL